MRRQLVNGARDFWIPRLPRLTRPPFGAAFDPIVLGYAAAVATAGGTVSASTMAALDTFVRSGRSGGWLAKLRYFAPIAGSNLQAALVVWLGDGAANFAYGSATGVNLVSADYDEASGITGNLSNKYVDIGIQNTGPTGGYGKYLRQSALTASSRSLMGANDATNNFFLQQNSNPNYGGRFGGTAVALVSTITPPGSVHVDRSSGTRLDLYSNGVSVASSVTNTTPAALAIPWFAGARNANGTPAQFHQWPFSAIWVSDSMTSAEVLAFHTAINALQTALGRNVV